MSFKFSAAHSSRIKKPTKPPSLRRSISSPFSTHPRTKPSSQRSNSNSNSKPSSQTSHAKEDDPDEEDYLPDLGLVQALSTDLTLRDVAQAILYIQNRTWTPLPSARTGMSSTRTAEILNFRAALPPIVTVAHVQALLNSATIVEREIAELMRGGAIRKIVVGGRGGLGEVLILRRDLDVLVGKSGVEEGVRERFLEVLDGDPMALTAGKGGLDEEDVKALMHVGFLTTSTPTWSSSDVFSTPGEATRGTATSLNSISRAASGSMAAVGGEGAVHLAGGSGGGVKNNTNGSYSIALPGLGPYLKLVAGARAHLVGLLSKSRGGVPESVLKERWDGGVDNSIGEERRERKRERGEFGVSLGRTRKWRVFNGIRFEWVLGECVGAGLVEVFETGSVGRGVRSI